MLRYESTIPDGSAAAVDPRLAEYDVIEESSGELRAHVTLRILPSGSSVRISYDVATVGAETPDVDVAWFVLNHCPIKGIKVLEADEWREVGETAPE